MSVLFCVLWESIPWKLCTTEREADKEQAQSDSEQDKSKPIKAFDLIPSGLPFFFDILIDWMVEE